MLKVLWMTLAVALLLLAYLPMDTQAEESVVTIVRAELSWRPYRGAVIVFETAGDPTRIPLSAWAGAETNLYSNDELVQSRTPLEFADGSLLAEIVELRFELGDEVEIRLSAPESLAIEMPNPLRIRLDRFFPWMDWMLARDTDFTVVDFRYHWPGCPNGNESHASWDICTEANTPVFCSIEGQVYLVLREADQNLYSVIVYCPAVGGFVQYGHVIPVNSLRIRQAVHPGQLIGHVDPWRRPHIHFSVFRPLRLASSLLADSMPSLRLEPGDPASTRLETGDPESSSVFESEYYQDPYYFHEPATWGYWNESPLPNGTLAEMKALFVMWNGSVSPR